MIARTHQRLPIEHVDEPPAPIRLAMNPEKLDELVASMRVHGQLQPGGVVPEGDRFVIVYGHRRFLACRALNLDFYEAYVYESESAAMLGAQLDENAVRHDNTPVEEAYWFAQLLEYCGGDTEQLAACLHKSREFVERRLNLLRGDAGVLAALKDGKIRVGVAERLNAYEHDRDRVVLLSAAIAGGATERLVSEWISDRRKLAASLGDLPPIDFNAVAARDGHAPIEPTRCCYCGSAEEAYLMAPIWVHSTCYRLLKPLIDSHIGGLHGQTPEAARVGGAAAHPDSRNETGAERTGAPR